MFPGAIHAGLGLEQLNNLLSSINVHPVSNTLWSNRHREVAPALSKIVKDSVSSALQDEHNATVASGESSGVTISVDGAWQSRGSGRSFNSASGHATAVGKHTRKVVGYAVRAKACRTCRVAKRRHKQPEKHECVHNWDGSSKAMEPDMVVQIIKDSKAHGVKVKRLVWR